MNPKRRKLKKLLWLVSIARNALVVLAASTAAFFTYDAERPLFKLSGNSTPLSRSRSCGSYHLVYRQRFISRAGKLQGRSICPNYLIVFLLAPADIRQGSNQVPKTYNGFACWV